MGSLSSRAVARVAVVCLVLTPATPPEFRWVDYFTTGLAAFWAVVLALEVFAVSRLSPLELVRELRRYIRLSLEKKEHLSFEEAREDGRSSGALGRKRRPLHLHGVDLLEDREERGDRGDGEEHAVLGLREVSGSEQPGDQRQRRDRTGDGPEVKGPCMSLILAMVGRAGALDDCEGEGVATLRERA